MTGEMDVSALLAAQCDQLFSEMVDAKLLGSVEAGHAPQALDAAVNDLDLSFALVSEVSGGAGLAWSDIGGVFEAIGYHVAPVELGESIIANWAIVACGLEPTRNVLGLAAEMLSCDVHGSSLGGSCTVGWSGTVDEILVVARAPDGLFLCLVDPATGSSVEAPNLARDPRRRFTFTHAEPLKSVKWDLGSHGLEPFVAVLRSAQIAGALSRMLELSIEYGNTRVQFGRPIGKFQSIQHMIAELAGEAAASKAAVQLALRGLDDGRVLEGAGVGKVRTSLAVGKASAIAHAVFGAIGVTEEHVLHYFTRRAWQWRADAGDEHIWSQRLGEIALAQTGADFWPRLVALGGD